MKPDAALYNPDPAYLRSLIERSGMSQLAVAAQLGMQPATLRKYLMPETAPSRLVADYRTQYALERLAD